MASRRDEMKSSSLFEQYLHRPLWKKGFVIILTRSWLFCNSMLLCWGLDKHKVPLCSLQPTAQLPETVLAEGWALTQGKDSEWLVQSVPQEATVGPVLAGTEPGGLPLFQEGTYGMETKTGLKSKWITTFLCPESYWHKIRGQQKQEDISLEYILSHCIRLQTSDRNVWIKKSFSDFSVTGYMNTCKK